MSDILHILVELEYMVRPIFNLENYYAVFHLQTCIKVGIILPMIRARVSEHNFFTMQAIDDIEFRGCLVYSLIYGYFIFNARAYGRLKYELGYLGVYALHYYFKLEVTYHQY
jgi:hypothetical protein